MTPQTLETEHHPGGLVHLLSAPEGSLFWAVGMRHEIQVCTGEAEVDHDYLGHCLGLLVRSGGWRLLRNARGAPFRSFIHFCGSARPHGLGFSRAEMATLLVD
jgi:hypothetical protein